MGEGGQQATVIVSLPATPNTPPCHPQMHCSHSAHPYLLVVGPDQAEDEAAVHQGQQVTEEEGQAGIEALGQLRVLGTQGLSAHTHTPHQTSVPTQGLALVKATSDFQEPCHCPRARGLLHKPSSPCSSHSQLSWLPSVLPVTLPSLPHAHLSIPLRAPYSTRVSFLFYKISITQMAKTGS